MDPTFLPPSLASAMHAYFYSNFNWTNIRVKDQLRLIFAVHGSNLSNVEFKNFSPIFLEYRDHFYSLTN